MIVAFSELWVVLISTGCFCHPRGGAHVDTSPSFTGCLIGFVDSSLSWSRVCKLWPHRARMEGHRPVADCSAPAVRSCWSSGGTGRPGVGQGCEAGSPPSQMKAGPGASALRPQSFSVSSPSRLDGYSSLPAQDGAGMQGKPETIQNLASQGILLALHHHLPARVR